MHPMQPTFEYTSLLPPPRPEDVWSQVHESDLTGPLVAQGLAQLVARPVAATAHAEPLRTPYEETWSWRFTKHLAQLAVTASVLIFVFRGGEQPTMALSWVAAALLLLVSVVVADRGRFLDHQPDFQVVGAHRPTVVAQVPTQLALPPTAAMPSRIEVT